MYSNSVSVINSPVLQHSNKLEKKKRQVHSSVSLVIQGTESFPFLCIHFALCQCAGGMCLNVIAHKSFSWTMLRESERASLGKEHVLAPR